MNKSKGLRRDAGIIGLISFGVDMGLTALFSLALLWLARQTALPEEQVAKISKPVHATQDIGEKELVS